MLALAHLSLTMEQVSLLATILFSVLSFWGLFYQIRKIVTVQSVQSVLPSLYIINSFVYIAGLSYGLIENNLAIFINGLLIFPYLILHRILYKLRAYNKLDFFIVIFFLPLIVCVILTPYHGIIYLSLVLISLLGYLGQLIILIKSGVTGALSPHLFTIGFLSSTTWMVYAYSSNEPILMITTPISFVINILIVAVWYMCLFRQRRRFSISGIR